jgi:hypothetical protein
MSESSSCSFSLVEVITQSVSRQKGDHTKLYLQKILNIHLKLLSNITKEKSEI